MGLMSATGQPSDSLPLPVVFLVGPTAIGKSWVAIQIARALRTEVLTADSMQVYRRINIGEYRRAALYEISRLHRHGRIPLVVGGTGLYVRTLAYGLWEAPPADWE